MSRRRRQDNKGWIDEGPRTPNPGLVAWPLHAFAGPSAASRARTRDIETGEYRSYQVREPEA